MRDRGPANSGYERQPAEDAGGGGNSLENPRFKAAAMRRQIQRKAEAKAKAKAADLAIPEGGGSELSGEAREEMESKIGGDFSGVRIHTGSESRQAAKDLGAKAFTVGNDIHFSEGRFNPASRDGRHLLAHELTHVAQGQGGLREDLEDDGVSQEGDPAEKEADAVADGVVEEGGKKPKPKQDEEEEAEKLRIKKGEPYKMGTELWVQRSMFFGKFKYHHAGVYCGKGQIVAVNSTALKATKNVLTGRELASVEQTTLANFQGDGSVTHGPSAEHFTPRERAQRAVARLGEQWHYRPLDHNCQHFASEVVSGGPDSPEGQEIAHKFGMETHEDEEEEKSDKQKKANDANFSQALKQKPKGR